MSAHDPEAPTPFPDINAVLRRFVAGLRAALGEQLLGLYLSGSLAAGDFEHGSSDIDFLAVTADTLVLESLAAVTALHADLITSDLPYADRLEGIYLPQAAARRYDPANARHPLSGQANGLRVAALDQSWIIQYHQAREIGIPLHGPPAHTFIDPVAPDELRDVARTSLAEGWSRVLTGPEPEWLRTREYQAFVILTMCRALHTIERGEIASKPAAAAWATGALGPAWSELIIRALAWRHNRQPDAMGEMLGFVRFAVERGRES